MKTIVRGLALALASCAMLLASACGTLTGVTGGDGVSQSPRAVVTQAAVKFEPVLDELIVLVGVGVVSDNLADDIAQFGPEVRALFAAYFDAAEACVAEGGRLVSEEAAGGICADSALARIYDALDARVWQWAIKTGIDTDEGRAIVAGSYVLKSIVGRRNQAGAVYSLEPDVPLADIRKLRARLAVKFDALLVAAAAKARLTATAQSAGDS